MSAYTQCPPLPWHAVHCDKASSRYSSVFEEDTTEQPDITVAGVAPTAGEKGQCAAGHGNSAASSISANQGRGPTAAATRPDQEEEEEAAAPTGLNPP